MHLLLISPVATISADELVPDRWTVPIVEASSSARSGSQLAKDLDSLSREDRERQIEAEILAGNVPGHWKRFVPITLKGNIESKEQPLNSKADLRTANAVFIEGAFRCVERSQRRRQFDLWISQRIQRDPGRSDSDRIS
jgi:hypothetical protein